MSGFRGIWFAVIGGLICWGIIGLAVYGGWELIAK